MNRDRQHTPSVPASGPIRCEENVCETSPWGEFRSQMSRESSLKLTFLGTGTSFGVPVIGCYCPRCTSEDPRDRRSRHGAVLTLPEGYLLVDAPPELRLQLVRSGIDHVDSTGLGELVGYLQRFEKEGRRLALYRPHRRILSLLRLTRLDEIFSIYEDREEAITALSPAGS